MRRLAFVDALRGFAALYVILYHVTLIPQPALSLPDWAAPVVMNGGTGIILFFVVSAFSLCVTMPLHESGRAGIRFFYIRRFFRIAPLFYAMIVVTIIRDHYYFSITHSVHEILNNALFLFNFIPGGQQGFVWASWTIGVEMVFYLLFPLLYASSGSIKRILAVFVIALLAGLVVKALIDHSSVPEDLRKSYFETSMIRLLPIFLFGMLAHLLYRGPLDRLPKLFGLALTVAALLAHRYAVLPAGSPVGMIYVWGCTFSMLLLGLARWPIPPLVNRVTCFLGKLSYSLYLIHPTVVLFLTPVYRKIYAAVPTVTLAFALSVGMTLAVVVSLSWLSFTVIEQPGMRLGARVIAVLSKKAQPA